MIGSGDTILIVGGGAGAFSFASTYRDAGGDRPIVMLSADDRLPYFRPALSKELLLGEQGIEDVQLADAGWFAERDVEVELDCRVEAIDVVGRSATTAHGAARWGHCVLATGSSAGTLPVPGADDGRVLSVRAASDAEQLLARVGTGGSVAVVGSGFVGCEVAACLAQRGIDVTVISDEERPQRRRLGRAVGDLVAGRLHDVGVHLVLGTPISAIHHRNGSTRVDLPDRPTVEADHVVLAVGARPRVELGEPLGLVADGAIPVDAAMATAIGGVHAIGDIALAWNVTAGRRLRVEHWGDAERHGEVLGTVMAGERSAWCEVPGFWSTIAGMTLKYVAWGDGHDAVQVQPSASGVTVWYGQDDVVVGVLTCDHDDDIEVAATAVTERWPMPVRR